MVGNHDAYILRVRYSDRWAVRRRSSSIAVDCRVSCSSLRADECGEMASPLQTLSAEEVLRIHDELVRDFAASGDPIGQMGLRSRALLESAVSRQQTGLGDTIKFPEPLGSAATLAFGICCDHPFVNGNKRTALVAMLVHLDKNRLCIRDASVRESELYQLMLSIADHTIGSRPDPRRPDKARRRRDPDEEVSALRQWLSERVGSLSRGEWRVTYRQLRQFLARFKITLDNPHSNRIEVFKTEQVVSRVFRRVRERQTRLGTIGYRNEGTEVSFKDLKNLRQMCELTEEDGVDSDAFYGGADVVDTFINKYRTVLRRLAKT
jgi:prophage maintenance system killer protein